MLHSTADAGAEQREGEGDEGDEGEVMIIGDGGVAWAMLYCRYQSKLNVRHQKAAHEGANCFQNTG
jgi:hypothetical protein